MPDVYRHDVHNFADGGLQLRTPVDKVPPGQYSRLTNAQPIIEGQLQGRPALSGISEAATAFFPSMGVTSIFRLVTQAGTALSQRIFVVDNNVVTLELPNGTSPTMLFGEFDGNPVTQTAFRFPNDAVPWWIAAEHSRMAKYRTGPNAGYIQTLGIPAPQFSALVSSTPSGDITGTGYDWLYTFYNSVTGTESNPSIPMYDPADVEILYPQTVTSPDPGYGGSAFLVATVNPADPIGQGSANSAGETRQSANWSNWQTPTLTYGQLFLQIEPLAGIATTPASGECFFCIVFTTDGGMTWRPVCDGDLVVPFGFSGNNYSLVISLPPSIDLSQLQVRAVVLGVGDTTVPAPVTSRRVRQRGGNFDLTGLLTGGGGNYALQLTIGNIQTYGVSTTAVPKTTDLTSQQAVLCCGGGDLGLWDSIRLYRRGGSLTATYYQVGTFPVSTLSQGACSGGYFQITDNVPDTALGDAISFDNDVPVTSQFMLARPLPYLWGPFQGSLLATGDPDRPDAVYFSNPNFGESWASDNWFVCGSPSDPMQNGCVYNTRCFAFSHERMYEIVWEIIANETFTPFPTPCGRGLVSPWALCVADYVYFVAKDGVYRTDGGHEVSLVEDSIKPLFPTFESLVGTPVEDYDAVDMERIEDIKLSWHNNELWFLYRGATTGNRQCLIYDTLKSRWRAGSFLYPFLNGGLTSIYSEQATTSSLLGGDGFGVLYQFGHSGDDTDTQGHSTPYSATVRTGAYDQGTPLNQKEYGNVIFDVDPGGATNINPVLITPYVNGEALAEAVMPIFGSGRQQVALALGDIMAYNLEFEVSFPKGASFNPILYQFDILWRPEPASLTHWEVRESSYGFPGYFHLRDGYLSLRSQGPTTLTVWGEDDATPLFTLPFASTAGQRKRIYFACPANKAKQYRFSLDSDDNTQFRIYVEDVEFRAKPWLTVLGYKPLRALGGDSALVNQTVEGQIEGQ